MRVRSAVSRWLRLTLANLPTVAAMAGLPVEALSQVVQATLSGRVVDQGGGALPGAAEYQHTSAATLTRATAFLSRYRLNLFSNFTYALDNPERGDQFEQADRRWVAGGRLSHTRLIHWGNRRGCGW